MQQLRGGLHRDEKERVGPEESKLPERPVKNRLHDEVPESFQQGDEILVQEGAR